MTSVTQSFGTDKHPSCGKENRVTYRVQYNAHRYADCSDRPRGRIARIAIPASTAAQYPTDHANAILAEAEWWRDDQNDQQYDKPSHLRRFVGLIHWHTAEPANGRRTE